MIHPELKRITERIVARSQASRAHYLERIENLRGKGPQRSGLSCSNLAHGFAACDTVEKSALSENRRPNVAIVSAYNDMLSAHQPFAAYPEIIKRAAWKAGGVAQFAGGVPAMCDGVTQGQPGMELSLFSRDVIAMSTAVALSHDMFDSVIALGVCDKIVPGLLIGAMSFGHLPFILAPAGPMTSGLSNAAKAQVRQDYATGKVGRDELLAAESKAYHGPGTCTFYGTANSNQLMMEFMGLHLPGSSFINPHMPLREALTKSVAARAVSLAKENGPVLADIVDERAIVNGIVGLLASGGSTNHTIHLIAIARAAGILIDWTDMAELSAIVPLLARVYPNGNADVNHFHAAGGIAVMLRELKQAGLVHADAKTITGETLDSYCVEPWLDDDELAWRDAPVHSADPEVLGSMQKPFAATGGIRLVEGNLGRAIVKVSAVAEANRVIKAPARVFTSQEAVQAAFKLGELDQNVVVVVQFQGPKANGMPELHKLTPCLSVLQERGYQVALVTDGRMSGASGKVPAAIQVTPECAAEGPLAKLEDGDLVELDCNAGTLQVLLSDDELTKRKAKTFEQPQFGIGRELFGIFRQHCNSAEEGACALQAEGPSH